MQQWAELVSMWATWPTVVLSFLVVYMWEPAARRVIKSGTFDAQSWFVVGVTVGFAGEAMDNLIWVTPWSMHAAGCPHAEAAFRLGVWPNILFRQLCGCFAAYCHIRSAIEFGKVRSEYVRGRLGMITAVSCLAGLLYVIAIFLLG